MDKQIISFLIKAKQATYAGKGAETTSSREKSHDFVSFTHMRPEWRILLQNCAYFRIRH